ncbi:TetR/AcrR family transcriptional regulator [Cellulomonas sp. HZM]|uniref:TetR/AcrR family transcriptional regulator n=1 Tax=Cellulomonas sp. HZM TaxID=1454010 RepID=UPI000A4FCDE7|nr:TetR/AcrR family transcriptional regulator [Cellulomonas sp. HZM]
MDDDVPPGDASPTPRPKARRPRKGTAERRAEILRAAANTFGSKGYKNGSLTDVAEQVGITHAGVLHHFGTKEQLLIEVLEYRDKEDVRDLEGQHIPGGQELFAHLVRTARMNVDRRGIVQGYSVLTGESVTENHPARAWVTERFEVLRGEIADAIDDISGGRVPHQDAVLAASAIIGVMDGLQVQWLLDETVDLPESTTFAIEAILSATLVKGHAPRTETTQ